MAIANFSNRTIKNYRSALIRFLDFVVSKKVSEVSDELIEEYLYHCKTKNNYSLKIKQPPAGGR
ncbi:MAG: phage integrase N-terminal SAM-like domain-containing protein [Calditrichaceae bacterium]|nr:phage integrase N-terminal SAM-like domain-containing protein [Calditrichaceae bacterium]MBN2709838.1 phage integrase N-terminal SAM-like domain-containing protein [Calditrichaceae bacterium]RQV95401.1 MAG: hypothetical protein EH224_07685 [Calditrichota bacterium]